MHACMIYVCVYVCLCACVCVWVHVCVCVSLYVCVSLFVYVCMFVCVYVSVCMCVKEKRLWFDWEAGQRQLKAPAANWKLCVGRGCGWEGEGLKSSLFLGQLGKIFVSVNRAFTFPHTA